MIRNILFATLFSASFFLVPTNANAARLDGCDPSATENQSIVGSVWKSKCLNASVNSVWEAICNDMTLKDAKKTSSQNGCWKLFSRAEYAKQK
jgi:hypothetical protein